MPRIEDIGGQIGAPGAADIAPARPNQAFADLGQQSAGLEGVLEQAADHDAALEGASALADFRAKRAQRQIELRTQATDPATFAETALADFDEEADKLITGHDNERVQAFLEQRLVDARASEEIESATWAANTIVDRRARKTVDTVNKYANIVNSNPGQFESALDDVDAMIDAAGLPLDVADKQKSTARAALARSAVYGQMETNPGGVLKQLQGGQWDDYLDNDVKISAVNAAQSEIKRRESEAKANAAMSRAENFQDAADLAQSDLMSRRMTGKSVDAAGLATIRAGFTDKQWDKYQSAAAKMDATFKVTGDMRSQSYAEIQQTLEKSKPKLAADGTAPHDYADQVTAHNEAQKIANDILRDRKADPASAARDAFPDVALAWDQQGANAEDPGHLRVAIKKTLAAQTAMGIAPDRQKPLPAQMAASIAGTIRSAPPTEAAKALKAYADQFGANWSKVYGQIAPQLDPNSAAAATLSPNMAAVLLETSRTSGSTGKPGSGLDDLRRTLGVAASGANSITAIIAEDGDFEDFRRAMSRKGRGGNVGIAWSQAAETLALGIMQREGVSKEAAAQTAIKELVGSKYNFGRVNSVPFVTPKRVDADAAEASARQIMQTFKGADVDLPDDGRGVLTEDTRAAYVGAIQRDGYWVTTTGNSGLELWVGGAPVTHKGQRIVRTWDQLSDVAITPPSSSATSAKTGR